MLKKLIGLLFVSASAPAMAHLTWIDVGQQSLGLSTGHNFPAKEITVKGEYVDSVRCVGVDGKAFRLHADFHRHGSRALHFGGALKAARQLFR